MERERNGTELWLPIALLAIGLVVAETVLGNRFSRSKQVRKSGFEAVAESRILATNMALLELIEARHVSLTVGIGQVHLFCYNSLTLQANREKAKALKPWLRRMPAQHVARVYPIMLIGRHPTSEDPDSGGGGTITSGTGGLGALTGRHHSEIAGTPTSDVEAIAAEFAAGHSFTGLHFIPENRWLRANPAHTVLHEVGHAIDYELGSHTPARGGGEWDPPTAFPGVHESECGGQYPIQKRAAVAYAHLIVNGLTGLGGASNARTIVETFRATAAFQGVSDDWWRTTVARPDFLPAALRGR